ncbi:Tropomyosin [Fasciolopsis buskii]|uniref:Tropomyosin n=1 Tax=Fasciolopsis buskii TaxID=27845 RepID=A0A8E0RJW8_9TREM|nr:Tropomyosin [Fasciolopsis buski]
MEHIKKKMQAMKLDKENALDEADQLEAKLREKELEMQTKDEEMAEIAKRIQQLETDKETAQTQFTETNQKLDETEKRATEADRTSLVEQLGPRLEPEGEAQPTRPEEIRHLNSRRKYQPEEPLYSDYGSDLDEEDDYLKRRGDLSTIDERTAMSEAISAVHLNSATIIKLAIIGAELQNIVKKSVIKAEAEVAALQKRIRQLEDELESTETRLTEATAKLEEASKAADESDRSRRTLETRQNLEDDRIVRLTNLVRNTTIAATEAKNKYEELNLCLQMSVLFRLNLNSFVLSEVLIITIVIGRKVLENRTIADEERINQLEEQLKESTFMAEDADRKYDEVNKITELEEELRIVGNNVKSLEISEQEAAQREEAYEENIRDLTERLKAATKQRKQYETRLADLTAKLAEAEDRAQESERLVNTLQADADRLEGMSFLTTFFVGSFLCACASPSRPCVRAFLFTLHLCRDVGARVIPEFGRSVVFSIKAERRAKEAGQLEAARQSDLSKLEDELVAEKEKYKALSEELDSTYAELTGN